MSRLDEFDDLMRFDVSVIDDSSEVLSPPSFENNGNGNKEVSAPTKRSRNICSQTTFIIGRLFRYVQDSFRNV